MANDRANEQRCAVNSVGISPEKLFLYKILSGGALAISAMLLILWTIPAFLWGSERVFFAFAAVAVTLLTCIYAFVPRYTDDSAVSYSTSDRARFEKLAAILGACGIAFCILSLLPVLPSQTDLGFSLTVLSLAAGIGCYLFSKKIAPRLDRRARKALVAELPLSKRFSWLLPITGAFCAVIVCVALLVMAGQHGFRFGVNFVKGSPFLYTNSGDAVIEQNVGAIHLDWLAGHVSIEGYEGERFEIFETRNGSALPPEEQMHWHLSGEVLHICFDDESRFGFHWGEPESKELTIRVPFRQVREILVDAPMSSVTMRYLTVGRSVEVNAEGTVFVEQVTQKKLEIHTVSGDITVEGGSARELKAQSESGDFSLSGISCTTVEIDGISGQTVLENTTFDHLMLESVFGNASLELASPASEIELDTVSADVQIYLPAQSAGFTAALEGSAGNIITPMPISQEGGCFIFGDGAMRIKMKSNSGDLRIEMKE